MSRRFVLLSVIVATYFLQSCHQRRRIEPRPPSVKPVETIEKRVNLIPPPKAINGIWFTYQTLQKKTASGLQQAAKEFKDAGINTVYLPVYTRAQAIYPSKAYAAAGGKTQTGEMLRTAVTIFKQYGIRSGAWFEYGLMVGPENHPIAQKHPDWLARTKTGQAKGHENGGFVFFSPAHPEVKKLINDMMEELARSDIGFDEIQMDRFRYTGLSATGPGKNFGYEKVSLQKFGRTPTGDLDAAFIQFRKDQVSQIVLSNYQRINAINPKIFVSIAPVSLSGTNRYLQDWFTWMDKKYVDLVITQVYAKSLAEFQSGFQEYLTLAKRSPAVFSRFGIGYRCNEATDGQIVIDSIKYAKAAGVNHGVLWAYDKGFEIVIEDNLTELKSLQSPWNK